MLVAERLEFWPRQTGRQEVADNAANSRFETVRLMRDRFIGDEGDFCKYGLLRALAGVQPKETDELSLGIVWYRVPESRIKYLDDPKTFRGCDPPLFNVLTEVVKSNPRTIAGIQQTPIWPRGTVFFDKPAVRRVPSAENDPWLDEAVEKVGKCDLVFLDPDTGLEKRSKDLVDVEHCSYKDVRRFWQQGQRSLVVYQHQAQRKGQVDQMAAVAAELEKEVGRRPWYLHFQRMSLFVIPSRSRRDTLKARFLRFTKDWDGRVKLGNGPA
jgi:hypothetical protein